MRKLYISFVVSFYCFASAAFAQIAVEDAYVRSSTPMATTGAIFLKIKNSGFEDDRLLNASTPVARKSQLHTHEIDGDIMRMVHVMDGFAVPAWEGAQLKRGGDHIMLMGLSEPLVQGETIGLTLMFEKAGAVEIEVMIDHHRKPEMAMEHSSDP